jgi:NADPH:quinone reductase-like Zn-dependent oxidoreductase
VIELPDPKAGADQLLIKIQAAGVNPMDRSIARGGGRRRSRPLSRLSSALTWPGSWRLRASASPGFRAVMRCLASRWSRRWGSAGTYAAYVVLSDSVPLVRRPEGVEPSIAAALPTPGVTALQIIDELEPLADRTVVIVGEAGGVGSFATQLAAGVGARVIGTARAGDAERVLGYGADSTIDLRRGRCRTRSPHPTRRA